MEIDREIAKVEYHARANSLKALNQEELFQVAYWALGNFSMMLQTLGPGLCIALRENAIANCPREEVELLIKGAEVTSKLMDDLHDARTKYLQGN